MSDELDEGLVARTAQLLGRGGFVACLAFIVLVGGASALVGSGAVLAEQHSSEGDGELLALAGAFVGVVMVHAAPLAAFALAVEERPRLVAALARAIKCSWRVAGPTVVLFAPYMFGTCAITALGDIARDDQLPLLVVAIVAGIATIGTSLAAWIHGRWVLLLAASLVLDRYDASGPFSARQHLQLAAIGGIPVGTVVAFACQSLVRHVKLSASLTGTLDLFVTIAFVLALAVAVIVSCAAAVAFATPPRAGSSSGS